MKKQISVLLAVLLFFSTFAVLNLVHADSGIILDKNVYFGFTNGWLNFDMTENFTTVYYDNVANMWYFDNVGILLDGANATITQWLTNNQTVFNLTSTQYTTTVTMNVTNITLFFETIIYGVDSSTTGSGMFGSPGDPFGYSWLTGIKSGYSNENMTFTFSPMFYYNEYAYMQTPSMWIPGVTAWNFLGLQTGPIAESKGQYFWISVEIVDEDYATNLQDVKIEFSNLYHITLNYKSGTWSVLTGNSYVNLDPLTCEVVYLDPWTALFNWNVSMVGSNNEAQVQGIPSSLFANDTLGNLISSFTTINQEEDSQYWTLLAYSTVPTGTQTSGNGNQGSNNSTQNNNAHGNTTPNNTQTNQTQTQIPTPNIIVQVPPGVEPQLLMFGIVAICLIVGVVGYYSGKNRKDPLASARKEWRKQTD